MAIEGFDENKKIFLSIPAQSQELTNIALPLLLKKSDTPETPNGTGVTGFDCSPIFDELTASGQYTYASSDPVIHWTMDNISGATLVDEIGTTNASIVNMSPSSDGKFDNCLAGGYLSVERYFSAGTVNFKSLSFWLKRIDTSCYAVLMQKISGSTGISASIKNASNGNEIYFYVNGTTYDTGVIVDDTNWHHLTLVEGANNNSHWIWFDGVKSSSAISTSLEGVFYLFGRDATAATVEAPHFDNVQIYDYKLTDEDVLKLYQSELVKYNNLAIQDISTGQQCFIERVFWEEDRAQLMVRVPKINGSPEEVGAQLALYYDKDAHDNSTIPTALIPEEASDDFTGTDGDAPRSDLWEDLNPVGSAVMQITDNTLAFSISSAIAARNVRLSHKLSGDFDIQVDFSLGTADLQDIWNVWLIATTDDEVTDGKLSINITHNGVVKYLSNIMVGSTANYAQTGTITELIGKLRIVRSGTTGYAYYWDDGWVQLDSISGVSTADMRVVIGSKTTTAMNLSGYFDNFRINYADGITGWIGETGSIPAQHVWDDNFVAVYHMAQDPSGAAPQILDSTANAAHGTSYGSMTFDDLIDGATGKLIEFDGVDDSIDIGPDSNMPVANITLESFQKTDILGVSNQCIVGSEPNTSGIGGFGYRINTDGTLALRFSCDTDVAANSTATIASDDSFYLAAKYDGSDYTVIKDSVEIISGTSSGNIVYYGGNQHIGRRQRSDYPDYFSGQIGEIRISNIARSDAWLSATALALQDNLLTLSTSVDAQVKLLAMLQQPWHLRPGGFIGNSLLVMPYAICSAVTTGYLEQIFGLKLLASMVQYYGDPSAPCSCIRQLYADANAPAAHISQVYKSALMSMAQATQRWGLRPQLIGQASQSYSIACAAPMQSNQQPYALRAVDEVTSCMAQVYAMAGESGSVKDYTGSGVVVTRDGTSLAPSSVTISADQDMAWLTCELELGSQADLLQFPVGEKFAVVAMDKEFVFFAEEARVFKAHGNTGYTIAGLSPLAKYDQPYADTVTDELSGMASSIAAELLAGLAVDWRTVDWYIGADIFFATDETPLALVKKLAAAVGAVVQSLPDGSVVVAPRYPVAVDQWAGETPAVAIVEREAVFSLSPAYDHRPGYNCFLVGDELTATDGLRAEETAISSTKKEIRVYQTPWVGEIDIRHTGGDWVEIEAMGIEERTVEEVVEFVGGAGSTQYPVYARLSVEWLKTSLGTITYSEDGNLTADIAGESLLAITYMTKCKLWQVTDSKAEQVQLVAEAA